MSDYKLGEIIFNYIMDLIESARELEPKDLLLVEPYEASIIWGPWVFSAIAARYGTGKTYTGLYLYHKSREDRMVYVTYVNLRELPDYARTAPYFEPYYKKVVGKNVTSNKLIDLIAPILLDPVGVKEFVGNGIKTTLPSELSELGRNYLKESETTEAAIIKFAQTLNKDIILVIDEFEKAITTSEQFRELSESVARFLREKIYDAVGPRIKLVLLLPEFHLNVDCLVEIYQPIIQNNWKHVEGVSRFSKLYSFDKEKLKALANKIFTKLEITDIDGRLPINEKILELICYRCEMFGKTRVSVRKLVDAISKVIEEAVKRNLNYAVEIEKINSIDKLIDLIKSGKLKWSNEVDEVFVEHVVFRDISMYEKAIYDGDYSRLGTKWLQILERFVRDLSEDGRIYGYSRLVKRPGFYSYLLTSKADNKKWILWLRTSDIRRPDSLINYIPQLDLETGKRENTMVLCLYPADIKVHKMLEKYRNVELVPLHKDELIALLYNAREQVLDLESAHVTYTELKSRIRAIMAKWRL